MDKGLGIRLSAALPSESRPGAILGDIRDSINAFVTDPLDRMMLTINETDDSVIVHLHPAAEPVVFRATEDELTAEGDTACAGPGYHAWLVDLLQDMGWRAGIFWDWTDADDTQYQDNKDFAELRTKMADALKSEATALLKTSKDQPDTPLALMMPANAPLPAEGFSVSPMGHWSRGWLEAMTKAGHEQTMGAAAEFFPAWDNRDSAGYWIGCGMATAWLALRWVSPAGEQEETLYKAALGCFARAQDIDPDIALPEAEVKEIWTLINGGGEDGPPAPWGTGFRRDITIRRFGNGWRANIPGYFLRETPPGLDATVFSFGECSIHLVTVPETDPGSEESAAYLIEQKQKEPGEFTESFTFENGGVYGWAESTPSSPYRNLSGILSGGDEACFITIVHEDTELQRDWAEKILRSVARDEPA